MVLRWCRLTAASFRTSTACAGIGVGVSGYTVANWQQQNPHRQQQQQQQHQQQQQQQQQQNALLHSRGTCAVRCEELALPQVRCGSCRLRDGRILAYHEEGCGVPVFMLHGMGSSRLAWVSKSPITEIYPGVRLIAIDRPGYGGSSPPPFAYSYSAFARDLAELADHLQVPRFCVAGHSSGGPYALAVAAELPLRVVAAAAISSDPPYAHHLATPELRQSDLFSRSADVDKTGLYGREPASFAQEGRAAALGSKNPVKVHAWKGGIDGWVCDFTLERVPWSFSLESITLGPRASIWVGGEDYEPIVLGAPFLQRLVSGSELHVVPGGGHNFCCEQPEHLAAILREMHLHFGFEA
eukprot:CAMPEP_0172670866 /NCGR_PEP_ID=MMETSP1074-20121228/10556_1 /TAXON_ID=2916 /ORGANISM="Ceratium fusus, Strain PA161109" /LENGTH=353 /DNA_ID=CAMNT_0013487829 /DNA_START=22 /DNA_END=1083 /DNA_ORIENTATION=+